MSIDILKKISTAKQKNVRLNMLFEYYTGKQSILNTEKPPGKPNNRVVTNFAKNIVNNTTGYYLGKPVTYSSNDERMNKEIAHIINYNDDAAHNMRLGKDISIFGFGVELLYIDDDGEIRYAKVNPMQVYIGISEDVEEQIEYAIRWYYTKDENDKVTTHIELYTKEEIFYYVADGSLREEKKSIKHLFGDVPINIYKNNDDCIGDFEDAIPAMDAYNKMQSESVNDFEKFADAILAVRNGMFAKGDENTLRDKNILELDNDGSAEWIIKTVNDTYVENIKNRLEKDIYLTTSTVNLSDENFANNASGVAVSYKLICMENRIAVTERYFKKGLQRRFEMICNVLNFKGASFNYTDIEIMFVRNLPQNLSETATLIQQLSGKISNKTALTLLPFIEDADEEMRKIEEEGDYKMSEVFRDEE